MVEEPSVRSLQGPPKRTGKWTGKGKGRAGGGKQEQMREKHVVSGIHKLRLYSFILKSTKPVLLVEDGARKLVACGTSPRLSSWHTQKIGILPRWKKAQGD